MIFGGETWHLGNEKKGGVANGVKGKFFWEKNGCMQPCLDKQFLAFHVKMQQDS